MKKNYKVVKTTTIGSLKNKINESKGNFALGQGFGSEPRFKSNVETETDYNRRFDTNGGFNLGDGFVQMNEEEMVEFIATIVESMKGQTEYHNLKFVDRIGNANGLFESQIKNIKNIIKSDKTSNKVELRKYINENVAVEMSDIYEGYKGLKYEGKMMVEEIKSTFNEIKSMKKSTNEAVAMTAEVLDVPMEMVQKMVEIQKEAYEARMEGKGETMNVTEKMCEVYEAYKQMSEGNMKNVYEELKEMLNPEPTEPAYGSQEGEEGYEGGNYGEYEDSEEDTEEDYEARKYDAEKRDYEDLETYFPLEEEACVECDDEEGYIEVDLVTPEDFKLLSLLSKKSTTMDSAPKMMGGSVETEKGYNDYEVPMNYTVSNPYSQYKFDTGLENIPYGKKKITR